MKGFLFGSEDCYQYNKALHINMYWQQAQIKALLQLKKGSDAKQAKDGVGSVCSQPAIKGGVVGIRPTGTERERKTVIYTVMRDQP